MFILKADYPGLCQWILQKWRRSVQFVFDRFQPKAQIVQQQSQNKLSGWFASRRKRAARGQLRVSAVGAMLRFRHFAEQPRAGVGGIVLGGVGGDAECLGRLLHCQANEISQFDQFSLPWVNGAKRAPVSNRYMSKPIC
jgi:hypothetical protein